MKICLIKCSVSWNLIFFYYMGLDFTLILNLLLVAEEHKKCMILSIEVHQDCRPQGFRPQSQIFPTLLGLDLFCWFILFRQIDDSLWGKYFRNLKFYSLRDPFPYLWIRLLPFEEDVPTVPNKEPLFLRGENYTIMNSQQHWNYTGIWTKHVNMHACKKKEG
jgi:hypothetical protein